MWDSHLPFRGSGALVSEARPALLLGVLVVALASAILCWPTSASAIENAVCASCHNTTMDTSVPAVNRDVACKSCHLGFVGSHPYHQVGANCGAACHPQWGDSLLTATPRYTDPASGAAFATATSKSTSAEELHIIHSVARWPANVISSASACSSCHAVAACTACHTGGIAASHGEHSASGDGTMTARAPWTGVVGYGVVGGDQSQRTAFEETNQCATAGCHALADTQAARPRFVEDYNHAIGGNPDDPMTASSAVSTTGTWRTRSNAAYSGNRMSYNNVGGSSFTATFTGSRVELVSDKDPYRGQAQVFIDEALVGTIDCYAPLSQLQSVVFARDVAQGSHTIRVSPTGERHASSRGAYVVVDAFNVYPTARGSVAPDCTSCHIAQEPEHDARPVHEIVLAASCLECHTGSNLMDIHATDAYGDPLGCIACHGTSDATVKAAVLAKDTDCSACHGSDHALDKAFCYGCHTPALRTYPGQLVADTHNHMTTALGRYGTLTSLVGSPVSTPECASCHRGHKGFWDSSAGNDFCFNCHAEGLDDSGWMPADTGGVAPFGWPGKNTFERTAHFQGPGRTDVIDSATDFNIGATLSNVAYSNGSLRLRDDLSIADGLYATMPLDNWGTNYGASITTWANYPLFVHGASAGWYWIPMTVDLGVPSNITATRVQSGYYGYGRMAQAIRVYTSDDNATWTLQGEIGTQGVDNPDIIKTFPLVTARYVRVEAGAWWDGVEEYPEASGVQLNPNRFEVRGAAPSGTWTSASRDISQPGSAISAVVSWAEDRPASADQTISASVSLDGGTNWSEWATVANGGTVPGLVGNDISLARIKYRVEMARGSASANQYLYGISTKIGIGSVNAAVTYPGSGAAPGSCANCHEVHGSSGAAGVRAVGNSLCFACHDAVGVSRQVGYAYEGRAAFEASAHGVNTCSGCHAPHGYNENPPNGTSTDALLAGSSNFAVCLRCHDSAANSANGTNIEQRFTMGSGNAFMGATSSMKHNVDPADWATDGTRVDCTNCHAPHSATATRALTDPDTGQPYLATVTDPSTTGVTLAPDKDTGIFEQNPGSNNGAGATTVLGALNTGSGPTNRRSLLLHFPMDSVPSTWTISSARLKIYTAAYAPQYLNYKVSPLTQAFDEGTGAGPGDLASVVGGASWNERTYGDGLWTGAGAGDWIAPGGDYDAATLGAQSTNSTWIDIECSAVINQMRQTGNKGLIVYVDGDATETLATAYTSEGLWSPQLELTFSGVPNRTVSDSATFCLKCHDGTAPDGVLMGARPALSSWPTDRHGSGVGAANDGSGYDIPGAVRPPFAYSSPAMQCSTCHDPHGSQTAYHLTSIDGKTEYSIASDGLGAQAFCSQCHEMPVHAGPQAEYYGYTHDGWKRCFGCHKHGANF